MNSKGHMGKVPFVRFERLLPGPMDQVWEFLTAPQRLPGWFGEATIKPQIGGLVTILGGHIRGVVTQWKPPRRLAYTWNVFQAGEDESPYPESYLIFELEARGNEVLLTLTHLPVLAQFEKQSAMGWHSFLDMLGAAVRGEPIELRETYMKRNAALYDVDLSKLVR